MIEPGMRLLRYVFGRPRFIPDRLTVGHDSKGRDHSVSLTGISRNYQLMWNGTARNSADRGVWRRLRLER